MAGDVTSTFSESWYRVANQRICLRPGIIARRQNYRGERWIVLENPFSNQFFRLRPEAYEFVARLRPERTVEQAWEECLTRHPDSAPGQEAAIQLLSQLYFANLLQYDTAADAAQLFERYKKRRQQEVRSRWLNIMFMRFPLLDPDRFLVKTLPFIGKLISPLGALVWMMVVGFGIKSVAENFNGLWDEAQMVLSTNNLPLLYLCLILVKTLHEFGHAYFCRKWGGEVHVMGVMLMIFTPIPYVDATSSWSFRNKWRRVLVGSAGMIVELFLAALAAMIWARTSPGVTHSIMHNIMVVASVSTLVFNLNPLLRFDGYYILSDLIEVPNLHQRAGQQLRHFFEHYVFGVKRSESPALTKGGAWGYATFGILSGVYRVVVFSGILLAIADKFLLIGLLMALVCLISWATVPVIKFIRYLAVDPRLDRVRKRAIIATVAMTVVLLSVLQLIPFPHHFRAPGIVRASERTELSGETAGYVAKIVATPGGRVKQGDALLQMTNPELQLELAEATARMEEVEARLLKAMKDESADLKPLMQSKEANKARVEKLQADVERLTVRARHDGIWIAPGIQDFVGRYLTRGSNLGLLVNPDAYDFVATVQQEDADALFARKLAGTEVRLVDAVGTALTVGDLKVIPGEQRQLPSPALGSRGGGEIPVEMNDERGNKTAEPYFKVIMHLPANSPVPLFDGVSGHMRVDLGTEPLLSGWLRRLWQLLQKRYQM